MKQIEAYKCEHCGKIYQIKKACEKHEFICYKNPKNFTPCTKCVFFESRAGYNEVDSLEGSSERCYTPHHCKKHNKYMNSCRVNEKRKKLNMETEDQLPNKCEDFKTNDKYIRGTITYECLSEEQKKNADEKEDNAFSNSVFNSF